MRPFLLLSIVVLALTGCETRQAAVADKCRGYGFTPGTPEFANCQMQVDTAMDAQQKASGRATMGMGLILLNSP